MTGPRVRVADIRESQGGDGLQYELTFRAVGNVKGCERFWVSGEGGRFFVLIGVNPMAVETMETGKEYDLIFSPVGPEETGEQVD